VDATLNSPHPRRPKPNVNGSLKSPKFRRHIHQKNCRIWGATWPTARHVRITGRSAGQATHHGQLQAGLTASTDMSAPSLPVRRQVAIAATHSRLTVFGNILRYSAQWQAVTATGAMPNLCERCDVMQHNAWAGSVVARRR
jgi:hypothetical protein